MDEKNAELLAEAHTTILGLIEENQLKLQDLLEKVCMVTNLDILFVLTNSLKSIRADIMKMKRYLLPYFLISLFHYFSVFIEFNWTYFSTIVF